MARAMGRPTTKRRLNTLDPDQVALEITKQAFDRLVTQVGRLFDPAITVLSRSGRLDPETLRETELYRAMRRLARYAVHHEPLDRPLAHYLGLIAELYSSVFGSQQDVEGMGEADPRTPLATIVLAARGRDGIDQKRLLGAAEVAVLASVDRNYANLLASRGEVPGAYRDETDPRRPWCFKPTKAFREWLDTRKGDKEAA